jgi:pilus assembly protein Flp/PilA
MLVTREEGQGLVEYALIIALIAIVLIVALNALAPIIGSTFSTIGSSLST